MMYGRINPIPYSDACYPSFTTHYPNYTLTSLSNKCSQEGIYFSEGLK